MLRLFALGRYQVHVGSGPRRRDSGEDSNGALPMKQPIHTEFTVFVPADAALVPEIAPRSAIVSPSDRTGNPRTVWLEGNLYGATNLESFLERCRCAAGRSGYRYPTAALMALPVALLRPVATFDLTQGCMTEITDAQSLAAWLDGEPLPPIGREFATAHCKR
jgi:hypothetical protein